MFLGFKKFHNSNSSVGYKMKNKHCCSVKYILSKDVRCSGNSIIHRWMSMLLAGIYGTTADSATSSVGGTGFESKQTEVGV